MMFFRFMSVILLTTLSVSAFAATEKPEPVDRVAIIVNDDVITEKELDKQVEFVRKQLRGQSSSLPPLSVLRQQVMEREIVKQIQLQLARSTGILVDDNSLNSAIENIAVQNKMNVRQFRDALEKDGFDFSQYREMIRDEIIINKLRQREVAGMITVTDQEVENFIATQQTQGNSNDEYLLQHILISIPEAANADIIDAKKKKAESVRADLVKGADFAKTAISVSNGPQALEGGNLGWRKAGQLPTLFTRVVPQMKKGDISEIIRAPNGFHILKLSDKKITKQTTVTQTHARHILLRSNELATQTDIVARLNQIKDRIEAGDKFEELARSNSDDRASASKGGDLDWVSPGDLVPQFEEVMDKLKENQISEPFQTPFGWHIVQVLARRKLDNTEDMERKQAKEYIRLRKIDEMTDNWMRQLREEAFVDIKSPT